MPRAPRRSPGASVRTITTSTPAAAPLVTHIFSPFSSQPSPSRSARACRLAASLPAPASESAKALRISPRAIAGNHLRFCSSDPYLRIISVGSELCTDKVIATEASPQAICSSAIR